MELCFLMRAQWNWNGLEIQWWIIAVRQCGLIPPLRQFLSILIAKSPMREVSAVVLASTRRPDGQGKKVGKEVTFGLKMDDTGVHRLHFRVIICPWVSASICVCVSVGGRWPASPARVGWLELNDESQRQRLEKQSGGLAWLIASTESRIQIIFQRQHFFFFFFFKSCCDLC